MSGFTEASEENSAVSLQTRAFINANKRIEFMCGVNRCKDDRTRVWRASSGSPGLGFTWRSHLTDFLFIYSFLKSEANILRKESQRESGRSRSAGRTFVMWILPEIIKQKSVSWCYSTMRFPATVLKLHKCKKVFHEDWKTSKLFSFQKHSLYNITTKHLNKIFYIHIYIYTHTHTHIHTHTHKHTNCLSQKGIHK